MSSTVVTFRVSDRLTLPKDVYDPLSWDYEGPERLNDAAHILLEKHLPDVSMEVKTIRFPVDD